jgi:membrane protein implicated in regulation of membrane protease activity
MTLGFLYLLVFLLGFTLLLVTGLGRRILHPTELCDRVVTPSHEHWSKLRNRLSDLLVSFITILGLIAFLVHGFSNLDPLTEIAISAAGAVIGAFLLRLWLCRGLVPPPSQVASTGRARVLRDIPPLGFGQVEVDLEGTLIKLAARSQDETAIPAGTIVEITDRHESVVLVSRLEPQPA